MGRVILVLVLGSKGIKEIGKKDVLGISFVFVKIYL